MSMQLWNQLYPSTLKWQKTFKQVQLSFAAVFFPRDLKNSTYIRYIRQLYSKTSQTSKIKHFVKAINVF